MQGGRDTSRRVQGSPFDLRKTGLARVDLRDPYHFAVTVSWPMFAGLAFAGLIAINAAFAALYVLSPGSVQNLPRGDLASAFFFSLETMATVGYGEMAPATVYGHVVAAAEIVVGMASTAILTGILFVRFSRPQARILFAECAVVTVHNGRPTLMIRIANGRLTMLTHAAARLGVLMAERSDEGQAFRRVHELALQRDNLPVFPLSWTLIHVIDADSPLAGYDAERARADDLRLFLTVSARDSALSAEVQDIHSYDAEHLAFGQRFVDMVWQDEAGRTTADLARLSLMEPEPAPAHQRGR